MQSCHPGATEEFANGRVHAYGDKVRMLAGNPEMITEDATQSLVVERAKMDMTEAEIFHFTILKLIRLFYQVLIGATIGFMCLHQLLDYIRSGGHHKK